MQIHSANNRQYNLLDDGESHTYTERTAYIYTHKRTIHDTRHSNRVRNGTVWCDCYLVTASACDEMPDCQATIIIMCNCRLFVAFLGIQVTCVRDMNSTSDRNYISFRDEFLRQYFGVHQPRIPLILSLRRNIYVVFAWRQTYVSKEERERKKTTFRFDTCQSMKLHWLIVTHINHRNVGNHWIITKEIIWNFSIYRNFAAAAPAAGAKSVFVCICAYKLNKSFSIRARARLKTNYKHLRGTATRKLIDFLSRVRDFLALHFHSSSIRRLFLCTGSLSWTSGAHKGNTGTWNGRTRERSAEKKSFDNLLIIQAIYLNFPN